MTFYFYIYFVESFLHLCRYADAYNQLTYYAVDNILQRIMDRKNKVMPICVVCKDAPSKYGKMGMCGICYQRTKKKELKSRVNFKPEFSPEAPGYVAENFSNFNPIFPQEYKKIPNLITVPIDFSGGKGCQ